MNDNRNTIVIRSYEELNEFLSPARRNVTFAAHSNDTVSIKDSDKVPWCCLAPVTQDNQSRVFREKFRLDKTAIMLYAAKPEIFTQAAYQHRWRSKNGLYAGFGARLETMINQHMIWVIFIYIAALTIYTLKLVPGVNCRCD